MWSLEILMKFGQNTRQILIDRGSEAFAKIRTFSLLLPSARQQPKCLRLFNLKIVRFPREASHPLLPY